MDKVPEEDINSHKISLKNKWENIAGASLLLLLIAILGALVASLMNYEAPKLVAEAAPWISISLLISSFYYASKSNGAEEHELREIYNELVDVKLNEDFDEQDLTEKFEGNSDLFDDEWNKKFIQRLNEGEIDLSESKGLFDNFLENIRYEELEYDFRPDLDTETETESEDDANYLEALFYDLTKYTQRTEIKTKDFAILVFAISLAPTSYLLSEHLQIDNIFQMALILVGIIPVYYSMKMYRGD